MLGFDFMLGPRGMKSAVVASFHSCCPKETLTPFHTIRERFLTPSGSELKMRLDAVVLTSFLLQRGNCRQLSSSSLVDMADDLANNAAFTIVYQLVITWTANQTLLGTNFFLAHVRWSHTFVSHTANLGPKQCRSYGG